MRELDYTVADGASLKGRLALVTGGARRVGAAIVRELAAGGADVLIHARRSTDAAAKLAESLPVASGVVQGDLAAPGGAEAVLDAAFASANRHPDLIVHAAASFVRRPLLETSVEEWDAIHALNLRAFFLLARGMATRRGERGGDLIAIADAAALELWPNYLAHSVSKAALLALVRALAKSLAPRYRVNAVVPGPVLLPENTPEPERRAIRSRTLLRRLGRPEHVAQAVRFLAECDFATGSAVEVTGGSQLWRGVPPDASEEGPA